MQAEQGIVHWCKGQGQQSMHESACLIKERRREKAGQEAQNTKQGKGAQIQVVLIGCIAFQTRIMASALDQGNATYNDAETAKKRTAIDYMANCCYQGAVRSNTKDLQESGDDKYNGAAHQQVHAQMEGIGAGPEFEIVLKGGMQEEHFFQNTFDVFQMAEVAFFLPPIHFFHITAPVLRLVAFVGYRVQFPAYMQGGGFTKGPESPDGQADKPDKSQIAKQVKQCCHAFPPVARKSGARL